MSLVEDGDMVWYGHGKVFQVGLRGGVEWFKGPGHKKLNPLENIYFQDTPSIPLEFAH